jgi:hypothetical protein
MNELQQLGLPKDISVSITRCFESNKAQLRQHFLRTSLRLRTRRAWGAREAER